MNKIYKVMYSKVKQCAVVVSEIAKSHGHNEGRSAVRKHAALTAAVLIALGMFSFLGMPTAQADGDLQRNDFVAANDNYWYWDAKANNGNGEWKKEKYSNILADHRDSKDTSNYKGAGAKDPGAITAGIYAQAGEQTVTIGNRNAGASKGSVFIGEHSGYNKGNNNPSLGDTNNYVTSVGFESDATGWGSIAIGSNALAENSKKKTNAVEYEGNENTTNNKNDDIYGIKTKPKIEGASVALGYSAQAQDGNIAIGAYSEAKADSSSNTTYVSVGNSTIKRRITNVANGTADTDVATVGQMNAAIAQTGGSVKAGWGITKSNDNTISVKHNLSTGDSAYAAVAYADSEATGLILGGSIQDRNADEKYGATTETSVIVGARNALASNDNTVVIGGDNNIASRRGSTVVGGSSNTASGQGYSEAASVFGGSFNISNGLASVVLGGFGNVANNEYSTNSGGAKNVVFGLGSNNSGGLKNVVYASDNASSFGGVAAAVNGQYSTGVAGGSTGSNARLSFAAGFQSLVTDSGVRKTVITRDEYERKWSEQTREFGPVQAGFNPITNKYEQDDKISTALGYQATADEPGTIAFGHDAGDESGYTYEWETLTDEKGNPKQNEIDGTTNDYTKAPKSVKKKAPYTSAYYNRLVKAADGIEDHDAVVMEQLKNASGVGSKIKIYQTDENGNIKFDENNNPIEDTSDSDAVKTKRETAREASKDDWGKALGAGTLTAATAKDSDQLVTGKTLYDYDKPTGSTNYVNANNTTGQNLSALDAQVKSNAKTLNDKTHNIKYYSVTKGFKIGDYRTNENNDGATDAALAGMAAGYETGTTGIVSTVVGSYSGVLGSGLLQGAAAVSVGTVNVNNNSTSKAFSGVANSIVGQANMTTDSNAAIIVGAGNNVTNSYRDLDKDAFSNIKSAVASKDANALKKALQDAVPKSGGQVMVMGGGNNVESAYMSQVVGVGNTVTGADSTYAEGTSTQYNFVDGFQNELTNGKNDYIIGSNNSVTGDHIDKNQSNIVVGDNHTLTNRKNNVVIGSADKKENKNKELTASDATVIGHNADVTVDGGVAIGSGSVSKATAEADAEGYDPVSTTTNKASANTSATWKATTGAVSIGGVNGNTTTTRRITNLAAGFNDTDAVNVAQIKKLASVDASNIGKNFKDGDVTTNENAWGEALGTGTVTKDNKQLVTGGTVYNEVRPSRDGKYVKMSQTTGDNLLKLDDQVKTNTDKLSDVDSRSVKYDTKTENGKTVVDNTKITLAGEGGTTITNLKAGVNDNDAATVGQLNSKIAGVTYTAGNGIAMDSTAKTISAKAGNGITVDTNGINAKAGTGITVDAAGINVNTGNHLNINANGKIDVDDSGEVAETGDKSQQLVTGKTVYDALHGGLDNITVGKDGKDGKDGSIGIAGRNGTNGYTMTIIKTEQGVAGVDGKDGITRVIYQDKDGSNKHTIATLDDGLKFKGDDSTVIAKKLDEQLNIIGGADSKNLTEGNIGVNSTDKGQLKVQLAKDLKGITSISNQTTTKDGGKDVTTGAKITLGADGTTTISGGDVNVNGGKITHVGSGADASGNYTTTTNAANIGDVQKIVNDAVDSAADTTNKALAGKANIDASNIGAKLKNADGSVASADDQKANAEKWGSAIGTGEIKADDGRMVTGKTVYEYNKPVAADGKTLKYVSEGETTGQNLGALDAQVKTNADDITNINNSISSLNQNAVKYDDSDKSKISLGGEGGTIITNVKDGALNDSSTDAVNGKQLYAEQTARKELETKVTSNTTEINNIKDGQGFTGKGKEVIRDLAKGSVKVIAGTNTTVTPGTDEDGATTYAVNVEGNGKVASGDTNLISGGTLYNEVHVDKDGTYIKSKDSATGKDMTVAQNLSALDSGLKTTSDLIHTNTAGDTIQIGGSSTATKIDVNGKDGKGRVITGVVSDANDPTSAANVGYVNGVTSANTQQIYRDMNNAYGRLNNNINKAAAGSNALAALHPLDYDPDDKADFAVGYGHYRNANAAAVGAFYHPNENTMVNVGVSLGNGDPGFNAGVSFKVGRGGAGREAMSKTEMAKVINSQSKEIDALKKDNADKDKRIDALEQKMAEILAKLDKNGK